MRVRNQHRINVPTTRMRGRDLATKRAHMVSQYRVGQHADSIHLYQRGGMSHVGQAAYRFHGTFPISPEGCRLVSRQQVRTRCGRLLPSFRQVRMQQPRSSACHSAVVLRISTMASLTSALSFPEGVAPVRRTGFRHGEQSKARWRRNSVLLGA
jgi:hypothetical protein